MDHKPREFATIVKKTSAYPDQIVLCLVLHRNTGSHTRMNEHRVPMGEMAGTTGQKIAVRLRNGQDRLCMNGRNRAIPRSA